MWILVLIALCIVIAAVVVILRPLFESEEENQERARRRITKSLLKLWDDESDRPRWRRRERAKAEQQRLFVGCPYCGGPLDRTSSRAHGDHIRPVLAGGPTTPENIVFVCWSCNVGKGSQPLWKFVEKRGLDRAEIERRLRLLGKSTDPQE